MPSMSEKEDLELEALQRQLDDAFETTRPRRGFEDELWLRMQARRPWWSRLRDAASALVGSISEAPAVPLGVVAVLLVVVVGVGVLSNALRPNVSSPTSLSEGAGSRYQGDQAYFGRLPSPQLHPGLVDHARSPAAAQGPSQPEFLGAADLYFGPANLTWAGTFSSNTVAAPVYRYVEPSADQSKALVGPLASASGMTVSISSSAPELPREPVWTVVASGAAVPSGSDPGVTANTFLAAHNLLPTWPDEVSVQAVGGQARVQFLRGFSLPDGGVAYLVNWNGERYGIEVDISGSRLVATGPLPLGLDEASYRLISNEKAAQLAVSSAPASSAAIQPVPTIRLDKVELVYALAISGGQGYYEPAYLFSGSFQYSGHTFVKRVLVPLVDPSLRSS